MKIPEVSLITLTCHHHHIHSLSPPLSFAGNFAMSNNLIWMYKGALFKLDASVFLEWGTQHQQALLKKRPILATVNPSLPQILRNITREPSSPHMLEIEVSISYRQSSYFDIAEHFEPTGVLTWRVLTMHAGFQREWDFFVVVVEVGTVCFIVSTDNKFWLQLFLPT